ncbi:DUF6090 family protein [Yeosuana sp. MJ-SS3]|uniref:DUF6090 family protein n=1 Tax=Gilvirhabdus luticola TaxID=3079858 RepID=A0ABU3U912_9FLAO|nr:DUF6090 family protein [Yeosuana sp. MJ-SS3]MDU8886796.1 DUF6090 family protein [Yeosuana sp. MJ-SS3]
MIKFFRKIRQKLLSENKFSKYLIYAIGEIILVMIGILLALQVNNWNEYRKQGQKEIVNLKAIKNDLQHDLNTEFIPGISYYSKKNKDLSRLRDFYLNKEIIPRDSLLKYFRNNWGEWHIILNKGAFENLKSTGIDIISNDSLRTKISSLYSNGYPEIENRVNIVKQFYDNEFGPILYDNIILYDSTHSHDDFDDLKNRKQIGNRIIQHYYLRTWLFERSELVKSKVELLIGDIDKEIERLDK